MEDEAAVVVEGPATVGVTKRLAFEVEDEAVVVPHEADDQLDGGRGLGVVTP